MKKKVQTFGTCHGPLKHFNRHGGSVTADLEDIRAESRQLRMPQVPPVVPTPGRLRLRQ